jgi:hypothetical protein
MCCRYDAGDCRMTLNSRTKLLISSLLLACGGSGLVTPGSAQTRILDTGTRVRVLMERQPSRFIGSIATVRPDTIILTVPGTRLGHRAVAVKEIAELEVSNGSRRLSPIGLMVGALTGAALTAAYNGIVQSQCFNDCPDRVSTALGAAVGGIVIGGSFHFVKKERWLRIAVPRPRPPG